MTARLTDVVADLARATATDLSPHWRDAVSEEGEDRGALARLTTELGWAPAEQLARRPRAHQLPALVHIEDEGWGLAEEWEGPDLIRIRAGHAVEVRPHAAGMRFWRITFPDAARAGETPRASRIFRDALMRRRGSIVTALVATVMVNIIALVTSLYSMQVYDRVIPRGGFATLWVLTVGVGIALLLDFLLRVVRSLLMEREAAEIDMEVSEYFFARAQAVRLDARTGGVGTMASQLRGMEQVRSLYSSASLFLLADFPFAILFLFMIWVLGGIVVLVPLIAFPLSLLIAGILAGLIRDATERAQVTGNRKNGLLVEMLDSAETVKANRGGWYMLGRWNQLIESVIGSEEPVRKWSATANAVFGTVQQIAYIGLVAFGAIEVARGAMTTGALVAATIIAGRVNGPLMAQLPQLIVQWGYARSSLKALDQILAMPADGQLGASALRPEKLSGAMRLERVEFAYPGQKDGLVLPIVDIPAGDRIGVIGGIGSGKSTLLRLLAGLYAPHRGIVTIDGLDIARVAESTLRRDVGYLPQEFRLVNGTLRENLLMGLSDPGDQAVMEAAATTGLAQLIAAHPLGLDLPISEGGRGLSGGQRTLTGLTRLLLANPSLWLLDEPTSNLDMGTEGAVMGALSQRLGRDSTMVLVTHKLALLQMCSRVIVMAGGRMTHDGPTQAVLQALQSQGVATVKTATQAAMDESDTAPPPRGTVTTGGITAGGGATFARNG